MKTVIFVLLALGAFAFTEQMMSLEELANFNVKTMDCSRVDQFSLIEKQMKQWEDLMVHHKAITHDIKILEQMEKMLTSKHHSFLETQVKVSGKALLKKLHKLELPLTKSQIGLSQVKVLKEQCHALDSENHEDRAAAKKELCRLLREYINNLNNCQHQCRSSPITVIKIKGQIKDLEIVRGGCTSNGSQAGVKVTSVDEDNHEVVIHHGKGAVSASSSSGKSSHAGDSDDSDDMAQLGQEAEDSSSSLSSSSSSQESGEEAKETGEETSEETTTGGVETTEETSGEETTTEETSGEETTEETTGEETTEETTEEETTEETTETTEETTETTEETTETTEETTETTEETTETTETTEETTQTTEETTETTE